MNFHETVGGQRTIESITRSLKTISDTLSRMEKASAAPASAERAYVICVDECYVRDSQYFDPTDLSRDEFDEVFFNKNDEKRWRDITGAIFVDVVRAADKETAIQNVATKRKCDPRILFAVEVR